MKANQAFTANDEAVSPVIGVILMVAITVVLAAVVFVLVSNLSKGGSQSAPTLAISTDDTADRLIITSAASGADWSRLTVKAVSCSATAGSPIIYIGAGAAGAAPHQNVAAGTVASGNVIAVDGAAASATACGTGTAVQVSSSPAVIAAGDFVDVCTNVAAATGTVSNVIIEIDDTVANSQVGQYTFTTVATC